jgi:hypothetical protein
VTLYEIGKVVGIIKARGLEGPYTVSQQNTDGTYQLSQNGTVVKNNVKERDLQLW